MTESILPASPPPELTALTEPQKHRMEAITRALELLDAAGVPFTFYASPDEPGPEMKVIQGQRLSYRDPKDVEGVIADTTAARRALHWAALKQFSLGLRGLLALGDEFGAPVAIFQGGRVTGVQKAPSKEPQVVV